MITVFVGILLGMTTVVAIKTITHYSEKAVARELDTLGANVLVLPKSVSLQDYYSADMHDQYIPEEYVLRLTMSDVQGVDNLSPKLCVPVEMDGRRYTLTGILPKSEFSAKAAWAGAGIFSRPIGCGAIDVGETPKPEDKRTKERTKVSGTLVVNLLSSPGAGKITLLEATARQLAGRHSMAVLVGDLETDRDARQLSPLVPTAQLTTGGACHLELPLVLCGLDALGDPQVDSPFIENVGNLVCPASHDLAEHLRVVLVSTTEGDDKPGKYPKMFRTSQAMIVTKLDLLPHVPFSVANVAGDARRIQPDLSLFQLCAIDGTGIGPWCDYLTQQRSKLLAQNV